MKTISVVDPVALSLRFDYRLLRRLPIDPSLEGWSTSRTVPGCCFSVTHPTPLTRPAIVALSPAAWQSLEINGVLHPKPSHPSNDSAVIEEIRQVCSGNVLLTGSQPVSHCYAGHQFGSYAGQLGDGAAIMIGECTMSGGYHGEVQLKGAGPTPYSRGSDGRKVLRSSIREFLCSEAMHYLGIPTTRAAALVTSESTVERDPLYNGNVKREKCTVVTRVAETFLRFGSFEICKPAMNGEGRQGPSASQPALVAQLLDTTTFLYYSFVVEQQGKMGDRPSLNATLAAAVFHEIAQRTAKLVALWQSYGFCHGVLNTDNMSIVGVTIDYGPYAFMPYYDTEFVPNLSDEDGRYCYGAQPSMVLWNLRRLADAFAIVHPTILGELNHWLTENFLNLVNQGVAERFSQRLGVVDSEGFVVAAFQQALQQTAADMHKVCCLLTDTSPFAATHLSRSVEERRSKIEEKAKSIASTIATFYCASVKYKIADIKQRLAKRRYRIPPHQLPAIYQLLETQPEVASAMFQGASVEDIREFLEQEEKRSTSVQKLKDQIQELQTTTEEAQIEKNTAAWEGFLITYYEHLERHSLVDGVEDIERRVAMSTVNPRIVLYPWVLSQAIAEAEADNFDLVQQLMDRIQQPFEHDDRDGNLWTFASDNATNCACSCSS